jgi:hypothetical protein
MKTFLIVISAIMAGAAFAQSAQNTGKLQTETERRAEKNLNATKSEKCNRIESRKVTYSGIAVAAIKADNKLQLLNPVAPEQYGSAEDSVVRDPVTRTASGLKIFSIEF